MSKKHTFKIHDESVNTYGFRMLCSGANLEEYNKNPVVLYNHNDWEMPVGRGENVRIEGNAILMDVVFDTEDPRAAEIEGKVTRGFLRMASVGAWPPEEASDDDSLRLPGQTGPTITRWTLREVSICPIGANHNALALYDRDTGKRLDLSDHNTLVRLTDSIKPFKTKMNMSVLTQMLKLSDSASEQAVADEVRKVIELNDNLQKENDNLKRKVNDMKTKAEKEQENQAVALIDGAIQDGRLDASGRDAWLTDFKRDFENTKVRLSSIKPRTAIAPQIRPNGQAGAIELRDMSFADILKSDRLKELKREPELYREKFREAYGHYPA